MQNTRKAVAEDCTELSILFDEYRIFYGKESDVKSAENFLRERIHNKDSEIFVAESEGNLVGFVQLYPLFSSTRMKKYWLLNDLFIKEKFRGNGFSKRLIEECKTICQQSLACGILLETGKDNSIGNHLYPNTGFELYDGVNFYEWTNLKEI